jgi:hypothetical protein
MRSDDVLEPHIDEFVKERFSRNSVAFRECRLRQLIVFAEQFIGENFDPVAVNRLSANECFLHTIAP